MPFTALVPVVLVKMMVGMGIVFQLRVPPCRPAVMVMHFSSSPRSARHIHSKLLEPERSSEMKGHLPNLVSDTERGRQVRRS